MFDRVDEYDVAILKDGKASADRRFKITKTGVPVTHILERVEIDHTPVDVFLVDDRTGLPCGRPTVTMLLDKFSRMASPQKARAAWAAKRLIITPM
ncbi:hypothetical protein WS96_06610 [Burkholderia sp. MSMB1835]|nr:hypothetical protein WS96_06610 [Burkholderia sp. MSMB1835]